MRRLVITSILTFSALFSLCAQTTPPVVTARIEPDSIMIGDRFDYVIEVEKDQVQVVAFPEFERDKTGIELVKSHPVDTLERNGRYMKLRKKYTLAAFDEGKYSMGVAQVLYADKNITDTLSSKDSLFLQVATFEIDSTSQSIYDIKAQRNLPFKFNEISGYVTWGIIILVLLAVLAYIAKRIMAKYGKGFRDIFKPAPPLPPHIVAIKALENLHNQKLWQNNKHKYYYSELTDILRTYIEARYAIGAMEMTSDEIIVAVKSIELPKKGYMDLADILKDADLVKFAKMIPDDEQNEADYFKAYYFIEETKPQEQTPAEELDEQNTDN